MDNEQNLNQVLCVRVMNCVPPTSMAQKGPLVSCIYWAPRVPASSQLLPFCSYLVRCWLKAFVTHCVRGHLFSFGSFAFWHHWFRPNTEIWTRNKNVDVMVVVVSRTLFFHVSITDSCGGLKKGISHVIGGSCRGLHHRWVRVGNWKSLTSVNSSKGA